MRIKESDYRELLDQVVELKRELLDVRVENALLYAGNKGIEKLREQYEDALETIDALNEENESLENALDKSNDRREFWQSECVRLQAEATAAKMQVTHYKSRLACSNKVVSD